MDEMLAEYGLDTTSAGLIAIAICAVGWFSPFVPEGVAGDAAGACSCRTSGMIDEVSPCDCPYANE